jgi:hypothetical protein
LLDWLVGSFWVADAMVFGMLAFFVLLGAVSPMETAGFAAVLAVLAAVLALHVVRLHRYGAAFARSPASRTARERRGF